LVNLSTITRMALCLWDVSDNPTTKSIEMTSYLDIGTSCGCRRHVG
jgi:hypothetical protein